MQTRRMLILGKSGSGKSFLVKRLLKTFDKNIFIFDTLGEYGDSGIAFQDYETLESYWLKNAENYRIVYQPLMPKEEFDYIAHLVYSLGNCVFIVEELDTFCSPYSFSLDFANIIQRGRHKNIDFVGVSQRPYGINRTISAQCREIISFQMSEPRDISFLSQYIGSDVELLRSLGKYEYLHFVDNQLIIVKPDGSAETLSTDLVPVEYQETNNLTNPENSVNNEDDEIHEHHV